MLITMKPAATPDVEEARGVGYCGGGPRALILGRGKEEGVPWHIGS